MPTADSWPSSSNSVATLMRSLRAPVVEMLKSACLGVRSCRGGPGRLGLRAGGGEAMIAGGVDGLGGGVA